MPSRRLAPGGELPIALRSRRKRREVTEKANNEYQGEDAPRVSSPARRANGIVCAAIVVFFCLHGILGCIALLSGFTSPFAVAVWFGVALIGVHGIMSVVTSYQQLTDTVRPPSRQKRRHLLWKWLTGGLLLVCAGAHAAASWVLGPHASQTTVTGALLTAAVAVVLATHLCFGSKSLLKDLGLDRRYRTVFRIVIVVLAAIFAIVALVRAFMLL